MPINKTDFQNKVLGKIKSKFEIKESSEKHLKYEIWYGGRKIARTYCSHGGKEIYDEILSKIKRQLKLDRMEQLYGLKNCPFSAQDYFNLLKEKNVISD